MSLVLFFLFVYLFSFLFFLVPEKCEEKKDFVFIVSFFEMIFFTLIVFCKC